MQEKLSSREIGVINGIHFSLCSIGELFAFILTIIWWSPQEFPVPMLLSVLSVVLAALAWSIYTIQNRRTLF
jgi:iron-regulated transporter 1